MRNIFVEDELLLKHISRENIHLGFAHAAAASACVGCAFLTVVNAALVAGAMYESNGPLRLFGSFLMVSTATLSYGLYEASRILRNKIVASSGDGPNER